LDVNTLIGDHATTQPTTLENLYANLVRLQPAGGAPLLLEAMQRRS
jgi:hypothetical protein